MASVVAKLLQSLKYSFIIIIIITYLLRNSSNCNATEPVDDEDSMGKPILACCRLRSFLNSCSRIFRRLRNCAHFPRSDR